MFLPLFVNQVMKSVFSDYKTPSMAECELLGREIGLQKRVVQVWFQNARAKEKKAKLAHSKMYGSEIESPPKVPSECKICGIKYNLKFSSTSMQDHLFSRKHIENLRAHINNVRQYNDGPDDSSDFTNSSTLGLSNNLLNTSLSTNLAQS